MYTVSSYTFCFKNLKKRLGSILITDPGQLAKIIIRTLGKSNFSPSPKIIQTS
jgi:hypothetical protein